MDEPVLFVRVGAYSARFGLAQVLRMMREARALARDVADRKPGSAEFAEAIVQRGESGDATSALTVWLLNDAMGEEQWRRQQAPPVTTTAQETPAAPATSVSSVAGACPVSHPEDVACPSCAGRHQERRNAQKREARASRGA